jgi:hypothetical protein
MGWQLQRHSAAGRGLCCFLLYRIWQKQISTKELHCHPAQVKDEQIKNRKGGETDRHPFFLYQSVKREMCCEVMCFIEN